MDKTSDIDAQNKQRKRKKKKKRGNASENTSKEITPPTTPLSTNTILTHLQSQTPKEEPHTASEPPAMPTILPPANQITIMATHNRNQFELRNKSEAKTFLSHESKSSHPSKPFSDKTAVTLWLADSYIE